MTHHTLAVLVVIALVVACLLRGERRKARVAIARQREADAFADRLAAQRDPLEILADLPTRVPAHERTSR